MEPYVIRKIDRAPAALTGLEYDPAGEIGRDCARIGAYPWHCAYQPDARAFVGYGERGFSVTLCAREARIQAKETRFGGAVCVDSCLEFFLMPFPDSDSRYLNIEVNPLGTAHIGLGDGREGRRVWTALPEGFDLSVSRHNGEWWAVSYTIPFAFLLEIYSAAPAPGDKMRGNFYTCDESVHPHFGVWHPVKAPKPDFHRPECFGALVLARA